MIFYELFPKLLDIKSKFIFLLILKPLFKNFSSKKKPYKVQNILIFKRAQQN